MPRVRTSSAVELLLPLQRDAGRPLRRQLETELREAVRSGRLAPGSILPSTRALSRQLEVSRGVVVEAYEQLSAEGYLVTRPGGDTSVAHVPASVERPPATEAGPTFEYDFRPGRPDVAAFPRAAWLRTLRRVLVEAPAARLGYLDGRGMPELRDALEGYLNRVRGTRAKAGAMVLTTGFAQGLRLTARVLRAHGASGSRIRRTATTAPSSRTRGWRWPPSRWTATGCAWISSRRPTWMPWS
jgi:GntR family transcriptional regulator / MocR family aminotransferase